MGGGGLMPGRYETQHRHNWERAGDQVAVSTIRVADEICIEYLYLTTYEREGAATALNTTARRVTVSLLPVQGTAGGTVSAAYGQPSYTASQIVGHRVRVWERVERRLEATGPVVVSRAYIIDTVLGRA